MYVVVDVQAHVEDGGELCLEQSAGTDVIALPAAEVETLQQQSSPHLLHCDNEALASAENENNLNVENENNNGNADRPVEATVMDVLPADENLETVADSQLVQGEEVTLSRTVDNSAVVTQTSNELQLSTETNTDVHETKSVGDRDVLSSTSYSDMIIEVQDHEFSDEELQEAEKKKEDSCEQPVQPSLSKSVVEQQRSLQQSADSQSAATSEQRHKSQPASRIIRLNRSFHQQRRSRSPPEYRAENRGSAHSGHRLVRKPADDSWSRSSDALTSGRPKLSTVRHSGDAKSSRPYPTSRLSSGGSRLSPTSRRLAGQKNLTVKVQYSMSPDSTPATSLDKPVSGESRRKIETPQQPVMRDVSQEPVQDRADGSSESPDSLSKTQLEILELEMRARAIKAMIRAQEEIEELQSDAKKRHSSMVTADLSEPARKMPPAESFSPRMTSQSGHSIRYQSSTTTTPRRELRSSLHSVIGRSIIKRAEFVARHQQRRVASSTQERFPPLRRQFMEPPRRVPQGAAFMTSRRTVRLEPDTRLHPARYVVATEFSSPRVVRFPSGSRAVALPFSRSQRQRRLGLRERLASPPSSSSRDDKRRVLVSSFSHRSVTRLPH